MPPKSGVASPIWLNERSFWLTAVVVGVLGGVALTVWLLWYADRGNKPVILIEDAAGDATMVVSVEGLVATPGVYQLEPGSRVGSALDAAGGVLPDADLASINRAARVHDGDRIIVPSRATTSPTATASDSGGVEDGAPPTAESFAVATRGDTINVNTASAAELEELPGIGPAKAEAIIEYRDANGPFRTVDDLALVPGISPEMVDDLRALIRV